MLPEYSLSPPEGYAIPATACSHTFQKTKLKTNYHVRMSQISKFSGENLKEQPKKRETVQTNRLSIKAT